MPTPDDRIADVENAIDTGVIDDGPTRSTLQILVAQTRTQQRIATALETIANQGNANV